MREGVFKCYVRGVVIVLESKIAGQERSKRGGPANVRKIYVIMDNECGGRRRERLGRAASVPQSVWSCLDVR
jgi:hypothetical protein